MKPEHWQRAKEIVPAARDLPPVERPIYLDEACGDDQELRREVESLLAADSGTVAFIEHPPLTLLGEPNGGVQEHSQVGAYRIERELGRGGMGVVYLAVRTDDEFSRQVAIKVLQPELTSEETDRRFRQEMEILANLSHPNIAKLFEGGRTADGRLYYLMEYVGGEPIDLYCRKRKLSLERRLRLFLKVCAAVQYAHTRLVVHRDIKPSNVLVTAEGEPKLLDFGVAKPLGGAGTTATALTGGGQWLFTPDYASPEQIAGDDVHTASDVYSLGVMLYELLAGVLPYRLRGLNEKEIRQKVCAETLSPPSTASSGNGTSTSTKGPSSADPTTESFRKRLPGDLDTIVLMALRKVPGERYSTAQRLADDIQRHLARRPIEARRPSLRYKARKFLLRNRVGVGVAGLFLALVVAAAWVSMSQYRETVRERDRAQQVTDFMVEVFAAADPDQVGDDGPTARQLLERAQERVLAELESAPRLKADLLAPIAHSYGGLGLHQEASDLGRQLVSLSSEVYGRVHPKTAEAMTRTAISEVYTADFDMAIEHLNEALEIWRSLKGEKTLDFASALDYLGIAQRRSGLLEEAEATQRRVLEIRRDLRGPSDPLVAASLNNVATVLQVQGKYREAMPFAMEALEIDRATVGDSHPNYHASLIGVGILARKSGDSDAAEKHLSEAVELGGRLYPGGHPNLSAALNAYALLKVDQGEQAGAEDLYRRSLEMDRKILGPGNPTSAITASNLAVLLESEGRTREAGDFYQAAFLDLEDAHGPNNPYVIEAQSKYAVFLWNSGEREEGIRMIEEVVEKRREHFDPEAPVIATDLQNLAFFRQMQGRLVEAERLCREALRIDMKLFARGHRQIVRDQHRLASILEARDTHQECEELAREALYYLQEQLPPNHWRIADARSVLGGCLAGLGRVEEARPLLESSYEFLKVDRGEDAWQTEGALSRLRSIRLAPQ